MRPPVEHIEAPPFPLGLEWVNSRPLHMHRLRGRPVLVEFWDFCRANSIRTLPYVKAWHQRYRPAGLQVVGVHASGFAPSSDPDAVRAAVARLEIAHPVVIDAGLEIWGLYGNLGWPARYLWGPEGTLVHYHYGEGAYQETEHELQALLGLEGPLTPLQRPEDAPGAVLRPQSQDREGPYCGPYEAGGVWAVLEGEGEVTAGGHTQPVTGPGCYELISHPRSTRGRLDMVLSDGVRCHAVCFTPGLA